MHRVEWCWPDSASIPTDDRGLAYGDGLFETIRITASGPVLLDRHRDRLLGGCGALGIPFERHDYDLWLNEAHARGLLSSDSGDQVLKLILTRGSGGRGYREPEQPRPRLITTHGPAPPLPREPVSVQRCRQPVHPVPGRAGFKTLERLDQVLASRELASACFEGLMPNNVGELVEGTRTNLLLIQGAQVTTPPRTQLAVAGTLRDWLVAALPDHGYTVVEQALSSHDLQQGGLILLNSVMGAVPVDRLDSEALPVPPEARSLAQWTGQQIGLGNCDS